MSIMFIFGAFIWYYFDNLFLQYDFLPRPIESVALILRLIGRALRHKLIKEKYKLQVYKSPEPKSKNTENKTKSDDTSAKTELTKEEEDLMIKEEIEREKKVRRKELEKNLNALNHFMFIGFTISMLITFITIWAFLGSS
jgi:hypothetical protein